MADIDVTEHPTLDFGVIDLRSCPSIFVLPTHLTLEELHRVEEILTNCGAAVTYDISEARLVLGKLSQKKRAALELRARGLWTEETWESVVTPESSPVKKRRLDSSADNGETAGKPQVIDLDLEPEFGEEDGAGNLLKIHKKGLNSSVAKTPLVPRSLPLSPAHGDDIRVIKLEWLLESMKVGHSLPLTSFTIYHASKMRRPDIPSYAKTASGLSSEFDSIYSSPESPSYKRNGDFHGILERAKADAATTPQPQFVPQSAKFRRYRLNNETSPSRKTRPKLYRKTTSEHEETSSLPPAPDWVRNNVLYACLRSAPLHPPNEKFINQLLKIKKIRELTLDEIGVRAYSTSIAAIAAYPYPLQSPEEVVTLPGCETRIANWFAEWKQSPNGTLEAASQLDTDPVYSTLKLFYDIWGVGPKSARDFYYHRQWRSLDDIIEQGWDSLSRVQQIGVKYYDEFLDGIPRPEVKFIADVVLDHAHRVRPHAHYDRNGIECIIVGGYRRGKELSGDVDMVLSHRDERVTHNLVYDVVASLEQEGWITHTLALHLTNSHRDQQPLPYRGETARGKHHFDTLDKALVVWQNPYFEDSAQATQPESENTNTKPYDIKQAPHHQPPIPPTSSKRNPNPHRRVDIIISPWRSVGCAVLGWSGDTTFERDLRRYAKKVHNWKFDSSGIRAREGSGGRVIDLEGTGETWQERERLVMEGLGVGWRPPEERD
ncbi:DNA-directed DNA polymerase [Emydomyces testavorans]|uniref:DNA-directed DNA polymerase n=1 Tax=Emydomyces testavorans TaxID=2070801 RepID=A0AAF0IID1_9EURO|nr:DNA-directed DNA polymerase [Emydomyces testavorans]